MMTKQYYNLVRFLALLGALDKHKFLDAQKAYPVPKYFAPICIPYSIDPRVTFEQLMDPNWRGPFT